MKTLITIEDGKITVQVDDQVPVLVKPSLPAAPVTSKPEFTSPAAAPVQSPSVSKPPISVSKPADPQPDRKCEICGGPMTGLHALAKTCSKKCRDEKNRRYQAANYKKTEIPKPGPAVKHQPPDEVAQVKAVMDEQRRNFTDPWNCEMCRNAGDLCLLHEKLTAEGKKPPVGRGIE